jgi:hypothetical protein
MKVEMPHSRLSPKCLFNEAEGTYFKYHRLYHLSCEELVITCDDNTVRTIQSYCKLCVLVQVIVESDSTSKSENVTDTPRFVVGFAFCIFSFSVFSNPLLLSLCCAVLAGVLIFNWNIHR